MKVTSSSILNSTSEYLRFSVGYQNKHTVVLSKQLKLDDIKHSYISFFKLYSGQVLLIQHPCFLCSNGCSTSKCQVLQMREKESQWKENKDTQAMLRLASQVSCIYRYKVMLKHRKHFYLLLLILHLEQNIIVCPNCEFVYPRIQMKWKVTRSGPCLRSEHMNNTQRKAYKTFHAQSSNISHKESLHLAE